MQVKQGCIVENVKKGFILQQVNCKGVMNSGVAKVIREAYPVVFEEYKKRFVLRGVHLGEFQVIAVNGPELCVVNLFGQDTYGKYGQHTNYIALEQSLCSFSEWLADPHIQEHTGPNPKIHHPKIGAGLGGGDWNKIKAMIEKHLGETTLWVL